MVQRYHALDSLRAVMMLLGILLHSAVSYVTTIKGWGFQDTQTHPLYDLIVNVIHLFRMPIFFVMAGFFAALLYDKRGLRKLMKNRFNRVGIPFVLFWLILFPIIFSGFLFANSYGLGHTWEAIYNGFIHFTLADIKTAHLWFLYYLMMIYAINAVVVSIRSTKVHKYKKWVMKGFVRLMHSNSRILVFAIITLISLYPMRLGVLDTSAVPIPALKIIFAYLIYYTFGWLLFENRELLETFKSHIGLNLFLACLLIPVNMYAIHQFMESELTRNTLYHWLTLSTGAIIIWLMIFSITGLFLKYLNYFSPWGRYISDASYWVYLIHLPIIVWLSGLMSPLEISPHVKFMVNCITATVLCFTSYHYLVRSTAIGKLLNGRTYPRSLPRQHEPGKTTYRPLANNKTEKAKIKVENN